METGVTRHEHAARSALWLPLFDELSDLVALPPLAAEAEEAGWHGVFVEGDATWWLPEFAPEAVSADGVRGVLRDGPLAS